MAGPKKMRSCAARHPAVGGFNRLLLIARRGTRGYGGNFRYAATVLIGMSFAWMGGPLNFHAPMQIVSGNRLMTHLPNSNLWRLTRLNLAWNYGSDPRSALRRWALNLTHVRLSRVSSSAGASPSPGGALLLVQPHSCINGKPDCKPHQGCSDEVPTKVFQQLPPPHTSLISSMFPLLGQVSSAPWLWS
jgi:hypothetical protein